MAYSIDSFDGYVFSTNHWHAGVPYEAARGTFQSDVRVTPRPGNAPIVSAGALSPHRLTVDFTLLPTAVLAVLPAVDQLLGVLDPRDPEPRRLVATRDADTVERYARVETIGYNRAMAGNVVQVVFVSDDPAWRETTATTASQSGSASPFSLTHTNAGQATVAARYRVAWTAQHGAKGAVVGQQYRKRMTLTNTQGRTIPPFPYRISLGDTAALVTATKAQADGDDLRVIVGGKDMPRLLQGWNKTVSFVWIVIPGMDAGEVLTIDVVYGNASATNPPTWTDPDPEKPVIDLRSYTGTANGGSTTTLTVAGTPWEVDEWKRGYLIMLTGTLAGELHTINSNTSNSLSVVTFSATIDSGDTFLIVMSDNGRWNYAVRQTEREDEYARGRWYLDSPKYTPNVVDFDSPGAWRRELVYDNRDSMGQRRWTMLTTGGSDKDPFAILDAMRTWEGNDGRVPEAGTSDGCSLTTPCPITELFWERQFHNPNGICRLMVGVRGSGAEEWAEAYADATATSSLTTSSTGTSPLDLSDFGGPFQMCMALGPVDEVEIGLDWKEDTGSATAGSTTTLTDGTKSWATNQFAGAKVTIQSGANQGRAAIVSANTPTQLTHGSIGAANAAGDRFVVRNPLLRAQLRDGGSLVVQMDDSVLVASALGAETAVYDASMTLRVGPLSTDSAGDHRALIGYAGGERRLFLAADEQVEVDADLRRARIWNTTSSTYTSELTDPTVIVQWHNGTAWVRSANWLPFGIGSQKIWLSETNIGTLSINLYYLAAWLGA